MRMDGPLGITLGILCWVLVIYGVYNYYWGSGSFTLAPGESKERFDRSIRRGLASEKVTTYDVPPSKIEAPPFVKVEVMQATQEARYINAQWNPVCSIKYKVTAASNAPKGAYQIKLTFPSGYVYDERFSIK